MRVARYLDAAIHRARERQCRRRDDGTHGWTVAREPFSRAVGGTVIDHDDFAGQFTGLREEARELRLEQLPTVTGRDHRANAWEGVALEKSRSSMPLGT